MCMNVFRLGGKPLLQLQEHSGVISLGDDVSLQEILQWVLQLECLPLQNSRGHLTASRVGLVRRD